MAWFAAHAIMYFKLKSGVQDRFTIWENVYLIEAENSDEAREKAEAWAKQEEGDSDGSLLVDEQPATQVFAGIRKMITVSHWEEEGQLKHGDEITYSEFQVSDEKSIRELVDGEEVTVEYIE
jgi:hypothetical protein